MDAFIYQWRTDVHSCSIAFKDFALYTAKYFKPLK